MNWDVLKRRLESPEMAVSVGIASALGAAIRTIAGAPEIGALIRDCRQAGEFQSRTVTRIAELAARQYVQGVLNDHDAAICAYLWALSEGDSSFTNVVAEALTETPGLWWSFKLARAISDIKDTHVSPNEGAVRLDSAGTYVSTGHPARTLRKQSLASFTGEEAIRSGARVNHIESSAMSTSSKFEFYHGAVKNTATSTRVDLVPLAPHVSAA